MATNTNNTKRVVSNTIILYVRMLVVTIIALYSSRIILDVLGVKEFGLYNVVGGVVGLFAFLRSSMEKATQRFLNVEMALPNGNVNEVFCVNLCIHIFVALLVLLILETVGLWFLNNYINIPTGREFAANCVYQCVSISLSFTILTIPYSACVIAHEKMLFYAVVSIIDAFLKLLIAFLLMIAKGDSLILYGIFLMGISIINTLLYIIYCKKEFPKIVKTRIIIDKQKYQQVLGYVSWTLLGQVAIIFANQGNNIMVNMFHSVTANAAMGIGGQVNGAITGLTSNFQTAFNPQITKSYAAKDYNYLKTLIFSTSKLSYILLFTVSLPIMFNIDAILGIWLKIVPPSANIFCIWFLWNGILNALSAPLNFCVMASGNIKNFQIITALFYCSDLIILYILFKMGCPPITSMYVKVSVMACILFVRLYFAHKNVPQLKLNNYWRQVLLPILFLSLLSFALGKLFVIFSGVNSFVISSLFIFTISLLFSYYIGLTRRERSLLARFIKTNLEKNVGNSCKTL